MVFGVVLETNLKSISMSDARNTFGKRALTQKSRKLPVRFDLTAMVSISFLLIIFFMLSSYMSRPQAMDLGMPEKSRFIDDFPTGCCLCADDRSMTLLLGKNNEIISYYGLVTIPYEEPKNLNYNANSLRKELFNKSKLVLERYNNDPKKGLIVIIKPSKESNYKNVVDVLDEMAIVGVKTYAIVDITPEEMNMLSQY